MKLYVLPEGYFPLAQSLIILDEDEMESETKMAALENLLPPEMSGGKLTCSDCGQVFTGIWVLKTHKEEEHGQRLPQL